MAIQTLTPSHGPVFPYTQDHSPKVNNTTYGDGYIERSANGINHDPETLSLSWKPLSKEEADYIFDFLKERGGIEAFLWQPPDEDSPRKFFCPKYKRSKITAGNYSVTATFKQDYNP